MTNATRSTNAVSSAAANDAPMMCATSMNSTVSESEAPRRARGSRRFAAGDA
jgi:hypothetical protein